MSWMKRAQPGEGPGAGPQPYVAPQVQPLTNQQTTYPNYPGGTGTVSQQASQHQQGQYWHATPPAPSQHQYNQQYGAVYQQEYASNANQPYQQAQYNHNYTNSAYTDPQQGYQQNYYQNQPPQNYPQNQPTHNDGWEDNWDWGWEESAKQAQRAQRAQNAVQHQHQPAHPEHAFNNANVLEESFAPTNTWNWAMDDKKVKKEAAALAPEQSTDNPANLPSNSVENNISPEPNNMHSANNGAPLPGEEVRTLSDKDVVKERMPNLAVGKRFHLDNLTPQWSIESQMSQESSDGPQTQSESTYRSGNQSRNSNSPAPNTDNSNFNYSQSGLDEGYTQNSEWSKQSDELTLAESTQTGSRRESHEELLHTMQDLTLVNHENPSSENIQVDQRSSQRSMTGAESPPVAMGVLPPPAAATPLPAAMSMPPPPPVSSAPSAASPARSPAAGAIPVAAPISAAEPAIPPCSDASQLLSSLPAPASAPPSNSQNPFKHTGPFAQKPKPTSSAGPGPGQPFAASMSSSLTSPAAVARAPASRPPPPLGFEANLETTPDNSERPDAPAAAAAGWGAPPALRVPDNMEVAPRSDRNEYLQTAHLSGDYGENAEFARDAPPPPPGLRRMVVGRHEPAPERDEPPPGLARMVPGRQTEGDGACDRAGDPYRDRPAAYRRADGGRTPEYGAGERRPVGLARATPAGEPSAPPEYAQYSRAALADNLQDLSAVSSAELEPRSATPERAPPEPARRSSADTDRDRDRDQRRDSRDRDGDGRHSRPDRDDRRSERDRRDRRDRDRDRRDRDESPDARRKRRSARPRCHTEDTDYYSDKERERRRQREGSYAARPPRPDEARRREERGPRRRYDAAGSRERRRDQERAYRDIDPTRSYGNRRRDRDRDRDRDPRRRGEQYSSPSRAESREATATDEEPERRRERRARHSGRRAVDPYYDGYGGVAGAGAGAGAYGDPYLAQRAQYEYYERLRASDPAAYMQLYKRLMAGHQDHARRPHDPLEGYVGASAALYGSREERGSVHSGRSSAAGLKGNDTDLNTEISLPTNLETSTVRSDRMTPHRFSTAHVKGSIASRHVVVVRPSWPVDGFPATVQLLSLPHVLQHDPLASELLDCPGPLVKGVTHKKSVIEYCMVRVRSAAREAARDAGGYGLLWELLALLLRQNGVVVGSDIAELLMKNTREHEYKTTSSKPARDESSVSGSAEDAARGSSPDCTEPFAAINASKEPSPPPVDQEAALDKLREYLLYGNRQEALEWAMSCGLWGHALQLAAHGDRRTRGAVAARFLAATPRADPLHTLYATLAAATPPAATCVSSERWGDWRPHAAIILANAGARPDHDTRTLTLLGDSLASRGLLYSAQFCYVVGGVQFARHPAAPLAPAPPPAPGAPPPRLALLLAEPRARTPHALAATRAILATEVYEYALSLSRDYVMPELQVYKFVLASRLVDCGQYERALAYVEQAARAVTARPRDYSPRLARALADMADRLKYHDPALHEEPPAPHEEPRAPHEAEGEGSPRHQQWLLDVQNVAQMMQAEAQAQQTTPQHFAGDYYGQQQQQYSWDQAHQYQQQQPPQPPPPEPPAQPEEPAEYSQQYYAPPAPEPDVAAPQYAYDDWNRTEEHHAQHYADTDYWQGDAAYGYVEPSSEGGAEDAGARPRITMPGARAPHDYGDADDARADTQQRSDRDTDTPKSSRNADSKPKETQGKGEGGKGGGWLGGILTKLSLRPPNQMILPDDKNPTIVWDPEKKRWKNLDGEDAEGEQPPPPPPRAADLAAHLHHMNTSTPNSSPAAPPGGGGGAPPPPVSNIFKMQKGRHIKKSYVDVFNPGGGAGAQPRPPAVLAPAPAPALAANPTYFVPAPAQGGAGAGAYEHSGI